MLFNGLSDWPGVTLSGLFYGHPHKIDASQVLGPGDKKVFIDKIDMKALQDFIALIFACI